MSCVCIESKTVSASAKVSPTSPSVGPSVFDPLIRFSLIKPHNKSKTADQAVSIISRFMHEEEAATR
jgi:hypothetical protein